MDKPNRKEPITIKINHQKKDFYEQKKTTYLNQPKNTEGKIPEWEYSDRFVSNEVAATENVKDDDFEWILPELEEETSYEGVYHSKKNSPFKKKKSKRMFPRSIIPVTLTVIFAVLVGASIGLFILKMVINDSLPVEEVTTPPMEKEQIGEGKGEGNISLPLSPITTFLVQGGAFQTVEGAKTEESKMLSLGIPAQTITKGEKTFLLIGVADSLENAKFLGSELQGKGIETYAKEDSFGGTTLEDVTEDEKALLEFLPDAYNLLTEIYSSYWLHESITEMYKDSFHHLESSWGKLVNIEKEDLQNLKREIDKGMEATIQYEKTREKVHLTALQQHLLNVLAIYHGLQ